MQQANEKGQKDKNIQQNTINKLKIEEHESHSNVYELRFLFLCTW